jgi:hypothetical protein
MTMPMFTREPLHQARDLRHRLEGLGLREVVAVRVLPRAEDHVVQQQRGHVDQHQADQDFVGVELVAQQGGDAGPGHAAQHARQQDGDDDPAAGVLAGQQRDAAGPTAPMTNWPSAPMFQTLERKHTASPSAMRAAAWP